MKKKLSLFLVTFLAVFAIAFAKTLEDKSVTYALTEGDTFTSGQTVEVKNGNDVVATITYGEDGGEAFKAAKADKNIEGFTAFTEGNGTNGNKAGGTFYTITPKFDGTIEVAVALNADKAFYILENGTALADYDGITESAKYYGTYKFTAKADKSYKIYCAGSKLGFYGFKYNYAVDDDDPTPVETKTIYMRPGVWASADAVTRYAVYAFNESDNAWFDLAEVKDDEGTFSADIPENYTGIILVRMDGTKEENTWNNAWNQTADIDFTQTADNTLFTIDATNWGDKYTPYATSEYTGPEAPAQKYNVLVDDGMVFGTVEADKYEAAEGDQVALKVLVKEEYQDTYELDALTVTGVDGAPIDTHEIVGSEYNYAFTMPAQEVTVSATFKEIAQPVEINSMGIRGTFPGLSWDEDLQMRPADDGNKTWIAKMENVTVGAETYYYKATANGNWNDYVLPEKENAEFEFGTNEYPAGTYNLTFTANVEENTIELVAEKVEEPQPVESVVLDFTAQGYENGQEVTSLTVDPVTVTLDKGTNSNSPKYYSTGDAVRLYGGGTMTVSSKTNISNITITFGTSDGTNEITASPGTYKDGVWTGDAKEVVFTIGGTTGNRRFQKLEVTLGEGGGDQPVVDTYTATFKTNLGWKPVYAYAWSGEGEAVEKFLGEWPGTEMTPADELDNGYGISFTAAEAPAFIIFNDGTKENPVEGVNKTADLAFVNGKAYSLIDNSIKTIADLNALANNTEFTFSGNAIVVAKPAAKYVYIKDETGSSLIYDQDGNKATNLGIGNVITAPWPGKVSIFNGLFEAIPTAELGSTSTVQVVIPEGYPEDVVADSVNKVMEIKGLTIDNVDGKNIKFTIGDAHVNGYNQFGIELPTDFEGKTYDVVGAIGIFSRNQTTTIQFQPITVTEAVAPVEDVYSVAGSSEALFGTTWNEKEGNEMTLTEGKYTWTKEKVALPAGDVKFKVVKNHSWNENWPEEDYVLNIPETAEYTVTITFDEETKAITAEATKTGEAQVDDVVVLAGVEAICGSSWNDKDEANMMAQSPTAANLYTITKENLTLNAGTYEYKVVLNGTWYPERDNATVVIENAGIYSIEFTFNKETKETNAIATKTGDPADEKDFSVSFTTDKAWEKVYAYIWNSSIQAPNKWPGIEIQRKEGVYTYEFKLGYDPDFIIFNDGTEEGSVVGTNQTADLPFVNGTTYTFSEEKATAWAGDPEEAIPATTGIEISAATCVYAGVQAEKIIRIVAKEIAVAAPARGLDNTVTGDPNDIPFTVTKKDGTLLVEDKDITVTDDPGSGGKAYEFTVSPDASTEVTTNGFTIKPKDEKKIAVTAIEVEKAKAPAPVADIVYDFVASGTAEETLTKVNLNFQVNMGEGKEDRTNRDFRGYKDYAGTILPAECQVALGEEMKMDAQGLIVNQNRYFAVYGLHTGDKVTVIYSGVPEGKQPAYSVGTSVDTNAKIGETDLVSPTSAINSGDVIEITKAGSKNYIVMSVFSGMRIEKVYIQKAALYNVTKAEGITNGDIKFSAATAAAGDEVTVTATPAENYELEAITVTGVNSNQAVEVTDGKFIMPADDVTVSATFAEKLDYYLVGNMTEWKPNAEYKLTANTAAEGVEYMITVDLAADAQFKIAKSNGTTIADTDWYPQGMGNNYGENGELQGAGKYTVYFRPNADGGDDWFYHVIFAQKFYNITVVNCDGMTITPEVTEATAGTKVWAAVAMTEGYEPEFPGFTNTDTGDVIEMTEGTDVGMDEETGKVWIIMPAQNLTITAKAAKVSLITLDLSQENGSATCISVNKEDPASFYKKEGKEIYLTVTPNAGYTADITVTAGEDPVEVLAEAGTYHEQAYTHKFIMPAKDVTVKVTFTKSTGINGIDADDADDNAPIYNLAGQKVDKNYKGVVIKNGKKIYQK